MTTSSQLERPTARVATKIITLPGVVANHRQGKGYLAQRPDYSAVHPPVRWGFYVFVFSLLFEWPDRPIPMEIPTLIGFIYLAFTLLQPKVCYRRVPKEICFSAVY